jgi:lysophospholipase L1-like esterase
MSPQASKPPGDAPGGDKERRSPATNDSKTKAPDLASSLGLALATTLLLLLAAEVGVRVFDVPVRGEAYRIIEIQQDGRYVEAGYWGTGPTKRQDPYAPDLPKGSYRPFLNFRFVYASDPRGVFDEDHGVASRINRHGCRGASFEQDKPRGHFRVLGIGDSYTFGEGVKDDETFLALLEGLLKKGAVGPEASRPEVINCGVSGYNTSEEVLMLERRHLDFQPDLVLLTFVINDAYDEQVFAPLHKGLLEGAGVIPGQVAEGADPRVAPAGSGSRLLDFLRYRLDRWRLARTTTETYLAQFSDTPTLEGYSWADSKKALARAQALTVARGARLAVVIFPELFRLDEGYPFASIHETVRQEATRLGLPVLDLFEAFRGQNARELWVHPTDHHPNELAHGIAARAIHDFLRNEGLTGRSRTK